MFFRIFIAQIDDNNSLQMLVPHSMLPMSSNEDPDSLPGPSNATAAAAPSKRRRTAAGNFRFFDDVDSDGEGHEEEQEESGCGAGNGGKNKAGKRGKPMSEAAMTKANRERARRERLNEYLDELAKLCDPSGKAVKGDRVSVVADAIRVVQQLRVENNQLKQLNKFLEERAGSLERARAQAMFQHAAATQIQQQQQQQQQQQHQQGNGNGNADEGPSTVAAGVQHVLVPIPIGSLGAHMMALKQDHHMGISMNGNGVHGNGVNGHMTMMAVPHDAAMPPGAPSMAWLPAPDLNQDQKLRPPAA